MERTWESRELLLLDAVGQAQEHGVDASKAAKSVLPDLDDIVYRETLAALVDGGYLNGFIKRAAGGQIAVARINRLTPAGRRAVGQWPSDDPAAELLAVLQARIDATKDPDEKSRLERLRDAASGVGMSVLTVLITAAAKSMAGFD